MEQKYTKPISLKSAILPMFTILIIVGLVFLSVSCTKKTTKLTLIRIGWQVAWATQGQIAQVLKHTNILELNRVKGEFKGFTYGASLNEAALAGEIDVGFVADQPAASLIARGGKFKIVARLIYFRAAIIVPPESEVKQVSDLKGKTIAIPFGSTTHRIVLGMLKNVGLDPDKDVRIINMDITEQAGVVLAGTKKKWKGDIDALASWDPNIAIFENRGLAKVLKYELGLAVVYMSEDFIQKHPDAAVSFLRAYMEAYYYYAIHRQQANQWFAEEARIQFDPSLLDVAGSFEPNLKSQSIKDIDVNIYERHIKMMEEGADFAFSLKLTAVKPNMRAATDTALLSKAIRKLKEKPTDFSKVEIR
jgi:ABC-type nitrate/sulfonate/bicarbonate transport system substrate-binding protein